MAFWGALSPTPPPTTIPMDWLPPAGHGDFHTWVWQLVKDSNVTGAAWCQDPWLPGLCFLPNCHGGSAELYGEADPTLGRVQYEEGGRGGGGGELSREVISDRNPSTRHGVVK